MYVSVSGASITTMWDAIFLSKESIYRYADTNTTSLCAKSVRLAFLGVNNKLTCYVIAFTLSKFDTSIIV